MKNIQMKCKICGNESGNIKYEAKEMMFGFRDKFNYFQCSECECLQISEIPADMSKYYPSNYYSFLLSSPKKLKDITKGLIKDMRAKYILLHKGILGRIISNFFPSENLEIMSMAHLSKNTSILDIGCGTGYFLNDLRNIGFKNVLGADPYIKEDIKYKNGLNILKKSIHEVNGKWDLIMFHHSFEHMPDPLETLISVSKLLSQNGTCLIRIPIVSSYAWKHYKENWVQLDAPRHFFLHSIKSMQLLSKKSNLIIEKIIYDSTDFQFWGSEQYIKGIPSVDDFSYSINPSKSIFSTKEINEFKKKAKNLNINKQGDSCAIFLRKK